MRPTLHLFEQNSSYKNSELILLSVPWAATASFGSGQEMGPQIISRSSSQMDFFSETQKDIRHKGICFLSSPEFLISLNTQCRKQALSIIKLHDRATVMDTKNKDLINTINKSCHQMVDWVYKEVKKINKEGKKIGLVGGDHSCSEGSIKYFSELYKQDLGILHIDAHADLRKSYQGFVHSHASVMYNVMNYNLIPPTLVQVGIRDYCQPEYAFIKQNKNIHTFFDDMINTQLFEGKTWKSIVDSIINKLPKKVYVSLDVDGLQPYLFPNTGTPVPGGLSFEKTIYLLNSLVLSGREIISFDLVEVAAPTIKNNYQNINHNWDAQVGARLLYKLCQLQLNKI